MKFFNGKKTYIGMIILGIMGLIQVEGLFQIPNEVFITVATFAGVALRHGIAKIKPAG